METVKLDISIDISTQDIVDTGLTVEQWNALSDKGRRDIVRDYWEAMAQHDNGGIAVVTPGAEDA